MTYFLKKKKWMAWVVLLTFLFTSFMPSNLLAGNSVAEAATLSQIANGQDYRTVNYYKGEGLGQEAKLIDGANAKDFQASTSKTIMPTDVENEFDITLQVMTTETLSSYEVPQDAAVVIVLDTSYSMLYRENGSGKATKNNDGSYSSDVPKNEQRLTRAVNAINTFISNYKANMSGAAYLSVLTFNENANVVKNWSDLKKDTNYYTLQRPKAYAYTNIKAGLDLATKQLGSSTISDVKNKYVILVSDGEPTAGGKDGSHKTAAKNAATALRQNATLYTISYGSEGPTKWLESDIATPGCAFEAKNSENLTIALGKIYEHIKLLSSAWQVSDKMGEHINFLGFYNREGGYIANSTSVSVGGKDICTFADNQIDWNLRITPIDTGSKDPYSYTLKYRVRLDNTFNSFAENSTFDTNGATTLVYAIKDQADKLTAGPFTVDFDVPAVKGLLGKVDGKTDISFVKVDADNETPLANAQFKLKLADSDMTDHVNSHTADSAYMKGVTQTSSEDGKFFFSNIPSGHTYTLTETKTPDGYQPGATWTVEVNYGKVTVTDTGDETATPIVPKDGVITIVNHPNTGSIEFTKVDDQNQPLAGATFGLYREAKTGETDTDSFTQDSVTKTVVKVAEATSEEKTGLVQFEKLEPGDYYVKEISAPIGYVTDSKYYLVTVTAGQVAKVTRGNKDGNFTNDVEMTTISGQKNWVGVADNQKKSVVIGLFANNKTTVETITLDGKADANGEYEAWKYSFTVPKYDDQLKKISYTVKELKVGEDQVDKTGTTRSNENASTGYYVVSYDSNNITNTLVKDVTATKTWVDGNDNNRPTVEVELLQNNKPFTPAKTGTIANGSVNYTWTGVRVNDENGKPYVYSVKETRIGGQNIVDGKATADNKTYQVSYGNNGLSITNTLLTTVSGTKIWNHNGDEDYWPEGATVTVGLYTRVNNQDKLVMNGETAKTDTVNIQDETYSFSDLPKYDTAGQEITYVVKEQSVKIGSKTYNVEDGKIKIENDTYLVSDGVEANGVYNITNTLTGEGSLTVTKIWADTNDQDSKRPAYINFDLYQISTAEGSKASKIGTYTIRKADNSVTIQKQDDNTTDTVIVSGNLDGDTTWSYTFKNLAKCDANGYLYDYYVEENAVTNYITTYPITGNAENKTATSAKVAVGDGAVLQIKNTHTPETATLKIEKNWVGDENLTNLRGNSLTFTILAKVNNNIVPSLEESVTLKADEIWAAETINLPKYYQGQEITYLISEEAIPDGYEVSYKLNGSSTNAHTVTWIPAKGQSIIGVVLSWLTSNEKTDNVDCTVTATNTLVIRDFEMKKEYSGTEPANENKAKFTLTAVAPENNRIAVSENIAVGNDGKYTFSGLKYGVTYRVEEKIVPTGYEKAYDFYLKVIKKNNSYVVKAYSDSKCENAITSATKDWKVANGAYTLTNVVKTADFSFEKKFDSVTPEKMPTFTVRDQNNNDQNNNVVTVTLDNGNIQRLENVTPTEGNKYEFNNLECGTYTVEENTVSGYEPITFTIVVSEKGENKIAVAEVISSTVNGDSSQYSIWSDNANGKVLTNIAKTTSLTLSKTYNGIETGHATFTITEKDEENPMADIGLKDDLYTFSGLQYGKTYTVVENAPLGYVGVEFTIDVTKTDGNGDPIAEIKEDVNGLTKGSQGARYDYALVNKVKTTGFSFNKVFEENRNTTTPSFLAIELSNDGNETDNKVNFTYTSKGAGETITHQYSTASDALQYGKKYKIVETNTPAGYEPATPFEITIDLDENSNAVAKVTKFGEDFENGVLTNYLKAAKYEIHYHYQQLEETAQADYLGKYAYKEEGTVKTVPAKVGDQINFNNLTDEDKDSSKHVTTSSVYVFNAEKTETDNQNKIVVENVDGAKTVLNVYFDLRFAVQYHWKGADKKIHDDNTINEPKYDLTLNDVVNLSDNKAPNTDATPDNPWYLFNGQWYATTQQAFDWNFDNAQQWLLEEDKVDKENILTYVKNNVLHLYAAWNAKPAAAGNINVSKTVKVVNEKEGNTDRDKLFDFALDLYVTTGSGLTFEQAKANTTSPSAIDFKVTITDKDGKTVDRVPTLREIGNGIYQYLFQLKDGENASFDLKAVASTGSALIWFQLDETSAGEDVGFTTELTGEESAVSGLSGIGCVDENGVYTFGYVNTFTYEADRPTDPEDPTDPERPRDPSDPREPDVDIEDPDVPLAEPGEPPIEIEDPDVPLTDVPGEPIEIDEPEVPLGDAPKTGDSSNAIPFVVLMMVGITGLAITRRKFN